MTSSPPTTTGRIVPWASWSAVALPDSDAKRRLGGQVELVGERPEQLRVLFEAEAARCAVGLLRDLPGPPGEVREYLPDPVTVGVDHGDPAIVPEFVQVGRHNVSDVGEQLKHPVPRLVALTGLRQHGSGGLLAVGMVFVSRCGQSAVTADLEPWQQRVPQMC